MKKFEKIQLYFGIFALVMSVFVQGGFFQNVYIPVIIMLAVSIIFTRKKLFCKRKECVFFFLVFALFMALTFFALWFHQIKWQEWGHGIYMSGIFFCILYVCSLDIDNKVKLMKCLVICGVVESLLCLFCYMGADINGILVNHRYMGSFQYANAAAIWLAMVLLTQLCFSERWMKRVKVLMMVCLILTFSAGGIGLYLFALVLLREWKEMECFIFSGVFAGSLYVTKFQLKNEVLVFLLVAALMLSSYFYLEIRKKISHVVIYPFFVLLFSVIEAGSGLWLFGERIKETGIERLHQMKDGIWILSKHLWSGIGVNRLPGMLRELHVEYKTSIIHNSYLQLGVETGIFILIPVGALLIFWWWKHRGKAFRWEKAVMCIMMIHFFVDISFFFFGVLMTWLLCTCGRGMDDM